MSEKSQEQQRREAEVLRGNARESTDASRRNAIVRLATDWSYARRVIRYALHLPTPMDTEDRRVLEQVIFKHYSSLPQVRTVLFVGCDWYTRHYQQTYFPRHDYWTIDISERAAKFAGRQHVVDSIEYLDRHFAGGKFDLIFCNGVYGFGLDSRTACEQALAQCYSALAPDGQFVLGWNDIPARNPLPLDSLEGLHRFEPVTLPPFGTWRYRTATPYNHTYDFYRKSRPQ
jgi:SAM-dependent methyltransferase